MDAEAELETTRVAKDEGDSVGNRVEEIVWEVLLNPLLVGKDVPGNVTIVEMLGEPDTESVLENDGIENEGRRVEETLTDRLNEGDAV